MTPALEEELEGGGELAGGEGEEGEPRAGEGGGASRGRGWPGQAARSPVSRFVVELPLIPR